MDKIKVLFGIFIFVILISNVYSLGISPGRTTIEFVPGLEKQVEFQVINTENKDINIALSVEGSLKDYVNVSDEVVSLSKVESSKKFNYSINLPNELPPGLNTANVMALELPKDINDPGMVLQATVAVITQVYVYVPYPGKYIEASLDVVSKEDTNTINFFIPIVSRGEEEIGNIEALINIYKGQEIVSSFNSSKVFTIKTGERRELTAFWNPDVSDGSYRAVVTIFFDDEIVVIEKEFYVGEENLNLIGISVDDFTLGEVAKIRLLVQNKLSETVLNAYANMKFFDSDLKQLADIRSIEYNISPNSNQEMITYWDTESVEEGLYSSELNLNYNQTLINKNFKVQVNQDSISFSGVGFVVTDAGGRTSITNVLYIVIGVLIAGNLIWLLWYLRNRNRKK